MSKLKENNVRDLSLNGAAETAARPIILDSPKFAFIAACWLLSLTALIIVLLFRGSASTNFQAASVDPDRVISKAKTYLASQSEYPEFINLELMEFIKFIQLEIDLLSERSDVSIVVTSDVVLSGNAQDYSDYIYLHAKDSYETYLETRQNLGPSASANTVESKVAQVLSK